MDNTNEPGVDVKPAKRASASLTAAGSRLTILVVRKADGTAVVTVTTTDAKTKKNSRGMSRRFDSFEEGVDALKKLEHDAATKGWKKSARAGGFKARPDAFTAMPVAPKK